MRAALYARVSTQDQHAEIQLDQLRAYAAARSLEIVAEHVDNGVSGSQDRRPGLDALMVAARRREVDVVICTKLDRLARSVRHLCNVSSELEELGIDLVVIDQGIDTTTSTGRFLFNVLGAVAQLEGDMIRERTRLGLQAARRRGARLGRPPVLDARQRARVKRLARGGRSARSIAKMLDVSVQTVTRALKK